MKNVDRFLFILHILVGIGALAGGMMAILNPQTPGGITVDALKNSPFNNFLIPGIILFSVIGLGNLTSAITLHFKVKYHGYISSVFSWALVIWIVVQCTMLRSIVALHVIFFLIGLVEAALAMLQLFQQQLFPTNIILYVYKRFRKVVG